MDGGGLEWRAEERGDVRVLAPSGRVDEATANEFNERLGEAAASGGTLVLDLGGIGYMSSRGLRALTLAQRRGSELVECHSRGHALAVQGGRQGCVESLGGVLLDCGHVTKISAGHRW